MQVRDIMTPNPLCAETSTSLEDVARMMVDCDCGGIPVCEMGTKRLVGFVTDRDIVCRILARGLNPLEMKAGDAMTSEIRTTRPETDVEEVIRMMEQHKVRRIPITDEQNQVIGIVAQADIARRVVTRQPELTEEFEEFIEEVSEPKMAV